MKITLNRIDDDGSYGILLHSKILCSKFASCDNITCLRSYSKSKGEDYGEVDLSKCTNLKKVALRQSCYKVILPESCESVSLDSDKCSVDLKNCKNLSTFSGAYWGGDGYTKIDDFLTVLSNIETLETISFAFARNFCKGEISGLSHFQSSKELSIEMKNTDVTKLIFKNDVDCITNIGLESCTKFSTLDSFEHLNNLNVLTITNDLVSSLKPLTDVTSLTKINANNNKISSLDGVQNLVNLETLNVGNNSISDLYWLGELAKNNDIKLKTLDLSDNSLENNITVSIDSNGDGEKESVYVDNLSIIEELYNKGCTNINLKNNRNLDTSKLSKLTGIQY